MHQDNNLNVISTTSNQAYFAVANILFLTQLKVCSKKRAKDFSFALFVFMI